MGERLSRLPGLRRLPTRLARTRPMRVLFDSWHGRHSCNPRAIAEELLRRELPVTHVWVLRDDSDAPDGATRRAARQPGVPAGARTGPVRDLQQHAAGLLPQAARHDLRSDLARHAPQADRVRHRQPALSEEQALPAEPSQGGHLLGLPDLAQRVQHRRVPPGVRLRGNGARDRLSEKRPPGIARARRRPRERSREAPDSRRRGRSALHADLARRRAVLAAPRPRRADPGARRPVRLPAARSRAGRGRCGHHGWGPRRLRLDRGWRALPRRRRPDHRLLLGDVRLRGNRQAGPAVHV